MLDAAAAVRRGVPAALSAASAAAALAASAPFPDAPAGLREEVVLPATVVQGSRLDLTRFVDPRSAELLHEEVRRTWSTRPAPIYSGERDGWLTLTQLVGSAVETFEVRQRGAGSAGRRLRLSRVGASPGEAPGWLEAMLPKGSWTIERVTHADGGRQMTTLVAVTSATATAASREVVHALARSGFKAGSSRPVAVAGRGLVTFLSRGAEDIALTVSEHEGLRAVVMHWGRAVR